MTKSWPATPKAQLVDFAYVRRKVSRAPLQVFEHRVVGDVDDEAAVLRGVARRVLQSAVSQRDRHADNL